MRLPGKFEPHAVVLDCFGDFASSICRVFEMTSHPQRGTSYSIQGTFSNQSLGLMSSLGRSSS
jgi:hypothetical protein